MNRFFVFGLFLSSLCTVFSQERTDLIGKKFEGAVNKMVIGDSLSNVQSMRIRFLKDKAIIEEEKLSVTKQPRLLYRIEVAWRINKRNNHIIFSAGNKPYPYQDYKFYYRDENLVGLYSNTNDKMVVLDILFAETENK